MTSAILKRPISIMVSGPKAVGKSTAVAKAFSDAAFAVTNPNVLAPFCDWADGSPSEVKKLGINPDPRVSLELKEFDWMAEERLNCVTDLKDWLKKVKDSKKAGKFKYSGVVIDEISTYAKWAWPLFLADAGGRSNTFQAQDELEAHLRWLAMAPAEIGCDLICVAHTSLPKYVESKPDESDTPNIGKLKHPGGPDLGFGRFTTAVTQAFDVVVEMAFDPDEIATTESPATRVFLTQGSDDVTRGVRRFNFAPKEDAEFLQRLRARLDAARKDKKANGKD